MASGEVDLKILLEHDFKMIQSITGSSRLLINELEASHYWVKQSISLFNRFKNISANVSKLLDTCEPYWANKATAFTNPDAAKLWKTAAGLWSALPGEQKKFDEYVARRRRERIMGQHVEEDPELDEELLIADKAAYDQLLAEIETTSTEILGQIAALPDGLVPVARAPEQPAQAKSAAANEEAAKPDSPETPVE